MPTTFERWNGTQRGNYCTLPTIDVEIIENPEAYCAYQGYGENRKETPCGRAIHDTKEGPSYSPTSWKHVDGNDDHRAATPSRCHYCGTNEFGVVVFKQQSWSDESECSRCGGVLGFAIGD